MMKIDTTEALVQLTEQSAAFILEVGANAEYVSPALSLSLIRFLAPLRTRLL